jgi:hypothetical protein
MGNPVMPQDRIEIIMSYNGEMYVKAYENEFFLTGSFIRRLNSNYALDDFQKVELEIDGSLAVPKMSNDWFDKIKAELTLLKMKGVS